MRLRKVGCGNLRHNGRTGFQCAMHRTLGCDFDELVGCRSIYATLNAYHALEAIDLAAPALGSRTTIFTVLHGKLAVFDADVDAAKHEPLVLGIDS